jgi:acyl-CoA synthetase (AMP-forming)/AMP-acid ligase II
LKRGDRILMFLDDTPAYPGAFFGAVRSGFVPLLISTVTPPDLLQFYLSDARVGCGHGCGILLALHAVACKDTPHTLIVVNGAEGEHAVPKALAADAWLKNFPDRSAGSRHAPQRDGILDVSSCLTDGQRASCICNTIWPIAKRHLPATC